MRLAVAVAALLSVSIGCNAQQEDMRAKVQAEVDAARQASRRAAATFLDRKQPTETRLAAVKDQSAFVDRGDAVSALEIVVDAEEPPAIRVRALQLGKHEIEQDQQLVTELINLLVSQETPAELRHAMMDVGQTLLISGTGSTRGEDITAAMRAMSQDRDPKLRGMALGMLAAQGDDVAQQALAADLRDPTTELVPPATAVAMLALQPDGDTFAVLREVLAKPPNEEAQIEAAQALGQDPQSHDELQAVVANNDASDALRIAAAGALHANAPEKFVEPATKALQDEGAGDELRIFLIKGMQTLRENRAAAGTPATATTAERAFDQAVRRLSTRAKSQPLRDAAKEYATKYK